MALITGSSILLRSLTTPSQSTTAPHYFLIDLTHVPNGNNPSFEQLGTLLPRTTPQTIGMIGYRDDGRKILAPASTDMHYLRQQLQRTHSQLAMGSTDFVALDHLLEDTNVSIIQTSAILPRRSYASANHVTTSTRATLSELQNTQWQSTTTNRLTRRGAIALALGL